MAEHARVPRSTAESDDHTHDLAVYASKGKTFLVTLLALAFTAGCVGVPMLLGPADRGSFYDTPATGVLLQIAGGAFFGIGTIRALMVLFSSHPMLVVNRQGIVIHSRLFSVGTVQWSEIEALVTYRVLGQRLLKIVLRDPGLFRARQTGLAGQLRRLAQRMQLLSAHIIMGDGMMATAIPELLHEIRHKFHRELEQHHIQVRQLAR